MKRILKWSVGGWMALSLAALAAEPGSQPAVSKEAASKPTVPTAWYLSKVRVYPAAGAAASLAGARITGSNQGATAGFGELARIQDAPAEGQWLEINIPPGPVYRWIKLEGGTKTPLAAAEIEFFGPGGKYAGKAFGTAPAKKDSPNAFEKAFDGKTETYFQADIDNAYAGIDLGNDCMTGAPGFPVRGGRVEGPVEFRFHMWPPGPKVYYTTDGSTPTRENAKEWDGKPFRIERTTTVAAFASLEGKADSGIATATYIFGGGAKAEPKIRSYHIGNSLTDTCVAHLAPIAQSAGHDYTYRRKTIPGCSLMGNWESCGKGFGDTDYKKVLKEGVDHLFLQPFPNPGGQKKDTKSVLDFTRLAREGNPEVQAWVYAQWISPQFHDDKGKVQSPYTGTLGGQSWNPTEPEPWKSPISAEDAKTWADVMTNANAYYHLILQKARAEDAGAKKPILLCPGGSALVRLEQEIKAGKYPGVKPEDFVAYAFTDGIHLSSAGQYLVSCVHYACMYKESPEGKVAWATSKCTAEQARILQRIAWETVLAEPDSGVKAEK